MNPSPRKCDPPEDAIARLAALDESSEMLEAHALLATLPAVESWRSDRGCRVAARVCDELGAPLRARRLALGIFRRAPASPEGILARMRSTFALRGPFVAWSLAREAALPADASAVHRTEWLLHRARAHAGLRDFVAAERDLAAASEIGELPVETVLSRAAVAVQMDRYDEARALCRGVLAKDAMHRTALHAVAHLEELAGDPLAAIELLRSAPATAKAGSLALHLATLLGELRRYDDAHEWLERWASLSPLLEDTEALLRRRADSAYERGDVGRALELLRDVETPFHTRVRERLEACTGGEKRVLLSVPFVRQHYVTCAPATLAALGGFWKRAVDHLGVAEEICYDGTPFHSERRWAEENGWATRELTVTLDAARALLDRGLPFTVSTIGATSGHLQAVVGYDDRRGTLFIRDPFLPHVLEANAQEWLEEWAATGPRGLVLVPSDERARLDGVDFPDAPLYDRLHRLNVALYDHDRATAATMRAELEALAPDHRIALAARRAIAAYDGDHAELLACAERQHARFPAFLRAELEAIACMRVLSPRAERVARLERMVAERDGDPIVVQVLCGELIEDAREHERASRLLRGVVRRYPEGGSCAAMMASIAIAASRFDEATSLLRVAACSSEFDEEAARRYFDHATAYGRGDEARAFLEARAARLGRRSARSVQTLVEAVGAAGDDARALEILDGALRDHPDDGDLATYAACVHASSGNLERAKLLLGAAEGKTRPAVWLRAATTIALSEGDVAKRLELLERAVAAEPAHADTQRALATAVLCARGREAALEGLRVAAARFPHHRDLTALYIEWRTRWDVEGARDALVAHVATDPHDAWAQRQLALVESSLGDHAAARAALDASERLDPNSATFHGVAGQVLQAAGDDAAARAAARRAARREPDRPGAVADWLTLTRGPKARVKALEEAETLARERSVTGVAIAAFHAAAAGWLAPDDLLARVERIKSERPAMPAAWACVVRQLTAVGRHEDALAVAKGAVEKFPRASAAWLDLATAHLFAGDTRAREAALERALAVDPFSSAAVLELAKLRRRKGDAAGARELLSRAIERSPGTAIELRLALGASSAGDRAAAVACARAVLALDPMSTAGWSQLWSATEPAQREEVLAALRRQWDACPWNADLALLVSNALSASGDSDGALEIVDAVIARAPRCVEAHDARVELLAERGDRENAERACAPAVFGDQAPRELRGRRAWVSAGFGNRTHAIQSMKAIVAHHPDYLWGWLQLAQWHGEEGASAARRNAIVRCAGLAPTDGTIRAMRAQTLLEAGDRAAAKVELARAVDLAPARVGAALDLFDLRVFDDECAQAEELLPLIASEAPTALRSAEVQLRVRKYDDDGALESFGAMARDAKADSAELYRARRSLLYGGLGDRLHDLTEALLRDPQAHMDIGGMWLRTQLAREARRVDEALGALDFSIASARGVATTWLELAAIHRNETRIDWALRAHRDKLRAHIDTWGAAGHALVAAGQTSEARRWFSDWRDRHEAWPWMLLDVAAASRAEGDLSSADDAHRRAVASAQRDASTPTHHAWVALADGVGGDLASARASLQQARGSKLGEIEAKIVVLADAVIGAREQGGWPGFMYGRKRLATIGVGVFDRGNSALVGAHRRASRRIAAEIGGPFGPLWIHRGVLLVITLVVLGAGMATAILVFPTFEGNPPNPFGFVGLIVGLFYAVRWHTANRSK